MKPQQFCFHGLTPTLSLSFVPAPAASFLANFIGTKSKLSLDPIETSRWVVRMYPSTSYYHHLILSSLVLTNLSFSPETQARRSLPEISLILSGDQSLRQ